jgi:predicted heme/steroid binding protein
MHELESLTEVFRVQDTMRFKTVEDFLESYKYTGGKMIIADDGTIHRAKNPELENITLQEALKKSGKESLYVAEEGRVYESPMYLSWHRRYEQSLNDSMKETISEITPYKDNVDDNIAHLRDTYLSAEREYVTELLKSDGMKNLIEQVNSENPDVLFTIAKDIVGKVEMGLIPDEQMEKTEQQLIVILAAIQDKVLCKDLVLTPTYNAKSK